MPLLLAAILIRAVFNAFSSGYRQKAAIFFDKGREDLYHFEEIKERSI